jgi:hypothetical protein
MCRKTHKKCFRIKIVRPWKLFFFCTQYHGNTHWCGTNEKYVGLCNTFWISSNYVAFVRFVFLCMQYHGNTPWCGTNEKYVGLCNTFWISGNYVAFVRFVFLCMQYHGNTRWRATNEKYVGLCNTFWISGNYVAFVRFVFLCVHCWVDCWVFHLTMGNFMQTSQGGCLMQECLAFHHEIKKWLIGGKGYCNLSSLLTSDSGSLSIRFPDHNYRQCVWSC